MKTLTNAIQLLPLFGISTPSGYSTNQINTSNPTQWISKVTVDHLEIKDGLYFQPIKLYK